MEWVETESPARPMPGPSTNPPTSKPRAAGSAQRPDPGTGQQSLRRTDFNSSYEGILGRLLSSTFAVFRGDVQKVPVFPGFPRIATQKRSRYSHLSQLL